MKLFKKSLWIPMTSVFGILGVGSLIGGEIVMENASAAINMALGTSNTITINNENETPEDIFKTDYDFITKENKYDRETSEKLFEEDMKAVERATGEGIVLLWNKGEALPLQSTERKVSLFAYGSYAFVEGGTGSGYIITESLDGKNASISMKDAFTSKGFHVNNELWNLYKNYSSNRTNPKTSTPEWQQWVVDELPWSKYTSTVTNSFSTYNDVAFITISRSGGEYSDLHYNYNSSGVSQNASGSKENTPENGGYLGLTNQEEELLTQVIDLKNSGTFKKVVLLLNTANPLMFKDFNNYYSGIDAALWVGQPGSSGINAVVDVIRGDINPSGRLSDTFPYDLNSAPSTENDGNYVYQTDPGIVLPESEGKENRFNTYMVYQEGIYIGYRYYETRYEDSLINPSSEANSTKGAKNSTSNWNYTEEVAFPFGYGDSYTKFEYSDFSVTQNPTSKDYVVKVNVKNVGNVSGKEVVQVYLQKPYTSYDVANKIEKSSVELVGFAKTKTLSKNQSTEVTINVPYEEFKSYDANNRKTYIVEAGDYYLTVGNDSHNAINNILEAKNVSNSSLSNEYFNNYQKNNEMSLGKNFAHKITIETSDYKSFSKSTQTGVEITNQFDNGDINKYKFKGENPTVTYLSRSNWNTTYPVTPKLRVNKQMAEDLEPDTVPSAEGYTMPKYNTFKSGSTSGSPDVKNGDLAAYQFMDAPLWPELGDPNEVVNGHTNAEWVELWNQLLDQMSWDEQAQMAANSYHLINGAQSISLPVSKQENGPVGITHNSKFGVADPEIQYYYFVSYPSASVLASTFNVEVVEDIGKHMSEDMLFLGYNGIFGPGVNMHRSPYGGRAYEYPSEDPFLAGTIEYAESKGIESKGCMAYAKHFALNDQETNRRHVGIWSNEQATREIYLKAFEITFAEGGASATMNSFSRVGTKWNGGCKEMMTNVLRKEWGWDGINITDWRGNWTHAPMSFVDAIVAGTNLFDGNQTKKQYEPYKNNACVCQCLRESAKIVIYNVVRTNAMNGVSLSTRVIPVNPWWVSVIHAVQGGFMTIFVTSALFLVATFFIGNKKDKQTKKFIEDSDNEIKLFNKGVSLKKIRRITGISLASAGLLSLLATTLIPLVGDEMDRKKAYAFSNGETSEPTEVIIPEDTGEKKQVRFEFEDALFSGASQTSGSNYAHICPARSLYYNPAFSNGICIRTVSSSAVTNSFTFNFKSDKTVMTTAKIHMASKMVSSSSWTESNLNEAMSISNNGNRISIANVKVPKGSSSNTIDGSAYFSMVNTTIEFPIYEGENSLVFTNTVNALNVDYFEMSTSALITDFTKSNSWGNPNDVLEIVTEPTTTSKGEISIKCSKSDCGKKTQNFATIPVLSNANYEVSNGENGEVYKTTIYGKEFSFLGSSTPFEKAVGDVHNKTKTVYMPSKTSATGYDFFNPASWNSNSDVTKTATAMSNNDMLNADGELVFENAPQWHKTNDIMCDLFRVVEKDDGTFTHPFDQESNFKTDTKFQTIYNQEYDYEFTVKANGKFTFMFAGTSGCSPDASKSTSDSMFFTFDGTNVYFTGCGRTECKSSGEVSAACPLTLDLETTNTIKIGVIRYDVSRIVIKLYVNGNKIELLSDNPMSASKFDLVDGNIINSNVKDHGYGQRFGINLDENTVLIISNLVLSNTTNSWVIPE